MNFVEVVLTQNLEKHSTKPAIGFKKKDEWKELSWKKFSLLVKKTANALKNAGVQANDKVAIYSDNSAEWITFDLAIMAIGAVTVPIYSTNTKDQASYIIEDSQAKIILVGNQAQYDACMELLPQSTCLQKIIVAKKAVWIKKDNTAYLEDFISDSEEDLTFAQLQGDALATIIYTSGTTGVPKGVMLTHNNFKKAVDAHFESLQFQNFENETSLAFLPLTHVFERAWTLLCLYGGAKVFFLENPKDIAAALAEVRPTMMCAVPRFFQKIYAGVLDMVEKGSSTKKKIFHWALQVGTQVAEHKRVEKKVPLVLTIKNNIANGLVFDKVKKKMGGKLWFMPCGGASLSPEITRFFEAIGLHITVGYGLTETTATLTFLPKTYYEHGSAGKTLPGVELKIGNEGEILAKGNGIMKGYYKNPEATKEVFTEDGWFRTGDVGRIDENGNLFITDRMKDLMKTSNGKYIVPQQIENLLTNNNLIGQIMVVAEGRQFVSALVVPNFEYLQGYLASKSITNRNWVEIVKMPEIIKLYQQKIDEYQKELPAHEKVKRFTLMPTEFEVGTGEMTPTLKIKRKVVHENYKELIDKMYV